MVQRHTMYFWLPRRVDVDAGGEPVAWVWAAACGFAHTAALDGRGARRGVTIPQAPRRSSGRRSGGGGGGRRRRYFGERRRRCTCEEWAVGREGI